MSDGNEFDITTNPSPVVDTMFHDTPSDATDKAEESAMLNGTEASRGTT